MYTPCMYNAPSSGKRERLGAASEWYSDDLACYGPEYLIYLKEKNLTYTNLKMLPTIK